MDVINSGGGYLLWWKVLTVAEGISSAWWMVLTVVEGIDSALIMIIFLPLGITSGRWY